MSATQQLARETRAPTPQRFGIDEATEIAKEICHVLRPHCDRIEVAGSLRRRKPYLKDVEILFIPKFSRAPERDDFFRERPPINQADLAIEHLLQFGLLAKRPNINGVEAWGPLNKLGVHVPSGMPVDLFTATRENWFNYLVCRTGGEESNIRIASAAIAKGWKWNPYGNGFTRFTHFRNGTEINYHEVASEREVFEFVGLRYLEAWER